MRSILLITKERFKSNTKQYLQLGIALLLTTFCVSLAINLLRIVEKPFDLTFEKLKASHILLLFDENQDSSTEIRNWFSMQDEVEYIGESTPYITIGEPFIHKGKKLDMDVQLTERITVDSLYDKLWIAKGTQKQYPEIGEIWLPYHFESIQKIQLGDTLGIPANGKLYNVEVSAFVVDPHYLSNIFNPTRAWVAPGSLTFFLPVQDLSNRTIGVRLKTLNQIDAVWKRFGQNFDYSGTNLKYDIFKSAFSSFSKLISAILLFFGLVVLIVSLIILRTMIASHILTEFKQIGVLKSIGFTRKNIIATYIVQFSLLLILTIPIGLILARLALILITQPILNDVGIIEFSVDSFFAYLLVCLIVSSLVLIVAYLSSRKTGRIRPMDAIRNLTNIPERTLGKRGSVFAKNLPLPLVLSLRFIKNSRSGSISLGFGLLATFIVVAFAVNVYNSFDQLSENKTAWGFDLSDLEMTRKTSIVLPLNHLELLAILNNQYSEQIQEIIPYSNRTVIAIDHENEERQLFGKIYADSISKAGVTNLKGKHPVKSNEISLCVGTARDFGKRVGDSIPIKLEGQKKWFQITGIYQDISAFGQGYRLSQNTIMPLNPLFEPQAYGIVLKPQVDEISIKEKLQTELGETVSIESSIESRKSIRGLVGSMKMGVLILSILFICIALVLISSDIVIHAKQNGLIFAQLKSIGFTSGQLRKVMIIRTLLLFILFLLIGIPLGLFLGTPIMKSLTAGIGLVEFPFVISFLSIFTAFTLLLLFILLAAWFSTKSIKKVDPRRLVEI